MKQNCWQVKNCGREAGGAKAHDLGVCPASTEQKVHGVNSGKNGGRSCWAVTGTLCGGAVQGSFAQKLTNCTACEFYKSVMSEEGPAFMGASQILKKLK